MTIYYVDSASGSNTAPYDTWAKAATSLATIAALDAAGDTVYIASTHSETTNATVTFAWAGTQAAPTKLICADKTSGAPPATRATGALVATTGSAHMLTPISSGYTYWQGVTFQAGDTTNRGDIYANAAAARSVFDNCKFILAGAQANANLDFCNNTGAHTVVRNCTLKFADAAESIQASANYVKLHIIGGSIDGTGSAITVFAEAVGFGCKMLVEDFDMSAGAAAMNLVTTANQNQAVLFRNCKLPASWSGSLNSSTPIYGSVYRMENCDSGATNYRSINQTVNGSTVTDTAHFNNAGASDGTTNLSWKMVSTTTAFFPYDFLATSEIVQWNDTTGSAKTATVEIAQEGGSALNDNDIWLELSYLSSTTQPLGTPLTDATGASSSVPFGDIIGSASAQTTSTATWTGFTSATKQKLAVTFTPQTKGYLIARVCVAKASLTVYVDPLITIS